MEETVTDYPHQTAQPGESLLDQQLKRYAFLAVLQSGVFTFITRGVSQVATCDGFTCTANFDSENSEVQEYPLPLLDNQKRMNFWRNGMRHIIPPLFYKVCYTYTNKHYTYKNLRNFKYQLYSFVHTINEYACNIRKLV